jgi:hypothetical protein
MKPRNYITLLIFAMLQLTGMHAKSQEIRDDTIYTSTTQQTTLYFPASISVCDYAEETAFNRFNKRVENSMVSILAKTKDPAPTILKVSEGKRNHRFILVYKEELSPNEMDHDWENLKVLKAYVAKKSLPASAKEPPVVQTSKPNQPAANTTVEPKTPVKFEPPAQPATTAVNNTSTKAVKDVNGIMAKANSHFLNKKYSEARDLYVQVLEIDPAQQTARNKVEEIDKILLDIQIDGKYKERVAAGDQAFSAKNYEEAKGYYLLALGLKTNDPYAKIRLEETQKRIAETERTIKSRETEEAYQKKIIAAKRAFDAKSYGEAKEAYTDALELKPTDLFARNQITAIDKIAKELEAKRIQDKERDDRETTFNDAVAIANEAFTNGSYEEAKREYKRAIAIKSDAALTEQIKKIDKLLADSAAKIASEKAAIEKQKLNSELYKKYIVKADQAFELKKFAEATLNYKQALNYRDEQYPVERMAQIKKLETEIAEANELKIKYSAAIEKGKAAMTANDFNKAKKAFEEAVTYQTADPFATSQLNIVYKKIEDIAREDERNKKYDTCIDKAATAIMQQDFKKAQDYYKEAGLLKPAETYPAKMIVYFEGILLENAKKEEREELLRQRRKGIEIKQKALQSIVDKDWKAALEGFKEVLTLNPAKADEEFARQKIAAIELEIAKVDAANAQKKTPVAVAPKGKRERDQEKRDSLFARAERKKENERLALIQKQLAEVERKKQSQVTISQPKAGLVNSFNQADPIPYSHTELVNKYPAINFDETPAGQSYDATDRKNRSLNFEISNKIIAEKGSLNVTDSAGSIKVTCQHISFNGSNSYIKFLIQNNSSTDFLTGPIQLRLVKKSGIIKEINQRFITNFPVVMPKKEFPIVYVSSANVDIDPSDILILEVNDRTKKTKLKLNIPGEVYNMHKTAKL